MTPATSAAEQAERADLMVLRCLHTVSPSGLYADIEEVRDLLILFYGLAQAEAEKAIADAVAHGLACAGRA